MPTFSGHPWRLVALGVLVFVTAAAVTLGWEVTNSYRQLTRDSGDLDTARERLSELSDAQRQDLAPDGSRENESGNPQTGPGDGETADAAAAASKPLEDLTSVLILGSDAREAMGGKRADVIMLGLIPNDRKHDPMLVSLPRDLWVNNPCTGGRTRLNAGLAGCGDHASGTELMALMVQGVTGESVDHYVSIDFANFESAIEAVGGVELCLEHPTRERRRVARFQLPAGCHTLDSETALAWVRSRTTEQRVNGQWRPMPGVNDLTRNERQRDLLLQVLEEASNGSMAERLALADDMLERATVDEDLRLGKIARLAWRLRGVSLDEVIEVELPVTGQVTSGGAQVLVPSKPVREVVEQQQPGLLD